MIVEPTTPLRMAVLISGGGSNLGALLAACESESCLLYTSDAADDIALV